MRSLSDLQELYPLMRGAGRLGYGMILYAVVDSVEAGLDDRLGDGVGLHSLSCLDHAPEEGIGRLSLCLHPQHAEEED